VLREGLVGGFCNQQYQARKLAKTAQTPTKAANYFGSGGFDFDFEEPELILPSLAPISESTEGGNPFILRHSS